MTSTLVNFSPIEFSTLEILNNAYEILHSTTGRIRIRVPRLANDQAYANNLEYALRSLSAVTAVRINSFAQSLIISYDSSLVHERQIQEVIFVILNPVDALVLLSSSEDFVIDNQDSWNELIEELTRFLREISKNFLKTVATASMTVGIIGLVTPLIPGIPFLILSSLCLFLDSCIPA